MGPDPHLRRKGNARAQALSIFAFLAAIFTLFWFALTHQGESGDGRDAGSVQMAALAGSDPVMPPPGQPLPEEMAQASQAIDPGFDEATGRAAMPSADEYANFYLGSEDDAGWPSDPYMSDNEPDPYSATYVDLSRSNFD